MNYLAHAYLSFNQPQILIGNMISDFVKGRKKFDFPFGIQNGISLHRAIDDFTDNNPATKKAKEFFRPAYRLYSGAFVDVTYDHFLAIDPREFKSSSDLENFSAHVYQTLEDNISHLPLSFQSVLPPMKHHDWLYNYRYPAGIEQSFRGLVRRAAYMDESSSAFLVFSKHYQDLKECYEHFFPALKKFASDTLSNLLLV